MFGGYCANRLFWGTKQKRTLLLEAGPFLLAEHFQDLPDIGLKVPDPIDPATADDKRPREIVWRLPWRGNTPFIGTPCCVGGKSVYWGGWCPKLTDDDLVNWPPAVAQYLKTNYGELELQLGVAETTDFIQGPLYQALLTRAAIKGNILLFVPNQDYLVGNSIGTYDATTGQFAVHHSGWQVFAKPASLSH
jgi:hypothetical protein